MARIICLRDIYAFQMLVSHHYILVIYYLSLFDDA